MNNPIREIIKSNLQKLSKDELVDALADVYMACPPFSTISPIKEAINQQANIQRISAQFAEIKQPLGILEK